LDSTPPQQFGTRSGLPGTPPDKVPRRAPCCEGSRMTEADLHPSQSPDSSARPAPSGASHQDTGASKAPNPSPSASTYPVVPSSTSPSQSSSMPLHSSSAPSWTALSSGAQSVESGSPSPSRSEIGASTDSSAWTFPRSAWFTGAQQERETTRPEIPILYEFMFVGLPHPVKSILPQQSAPPRLGLGR